MRMVVLLLIIGGFSLLSAQTVTLGLPELSPRGSVSQVCGLTKITVDYGSPAVRGRKVWGTLVPFTEVWRMGANEPTTIEFSHDVLIENVVIPAGKYGMHAYISSESVFEIGLSLNTVDWTDTTQEYFRFSVQLRKIPFIERLRFLVSDFDDNEARIALQWENNEYFFSVKLFTNDQVLKQFKQVLQPSWEEYAKASQYCLEVLGNYRQANTYANEAYLKEKNWLSAYLLGASYQKMGEDAKAKPLLEESLKLGELDKPNFFIQEQVSEALKKYR